MTNQTQTPDPHSGQATGSGIPAKPQTSSNIAVIGAGAMGVVTAYHLGLAGAKVTFVVRADRLPGFPRQFALYSYDDASLKEFASFSVVGAAGDLSGGDFEFAILTPDGAALASDQGRAMLRALGAALRDQKTVVIVGAVGIGLRDLVIAETGLPEDRVIAGLFAMLAHQVEGFALPVHPPTDPALLDQADFAYRHINEGGFLLETRNPEAAERFVQLYDRCGIAKCFTTTPEHFAMMINGSGPINLLVGDGITPDVEASEEHRELWTLAIEAMRAIRGLSEHGEPGAASAESLTVESVLAGQLALQTAALPLDYPAFNALHHGVKVRAADVAMVEGAIAKGEAEGRDMKAARGLLNRLATR
ncbi:ketopantoate reductase family protein [Pseudomonas aeruginosa]